MQCMDADPKLVNVTSVFHIKSLLWIELVLLGSPYNLICHFFNIWSPAISDRDTDLSIPPLYTYRALDQICCLSSGWCSKIRLNPIWMIFRVKCHFQGWGSLFRVEGHFSGLRATFQGWGPFFTVEVHFSGMRVNPTTNPLGVFDPRAQ